MKFIVPSWRSSLDFRRDSSAFTQDNSSKTAPTRHKTCSSLLSTPTTRVVKTLICFLFRITFFFSPPNSLASRILKQRKEGEEGRSAPGHLTAEVLQLIIAPAEGVRWVETATLHLWEGCHRQHTHPNAAFRFHIQVRGS